MVHHKSPVLTVSETPAQIETRETRLAAARKTEIGRPSHWDTEHSCKEAVGGFSNPWTSWRTSGIGDAFSMIGTSITSFPTLPKDLASKIPVRDPTWGYAPNNANADKLKATWLGHACFLVEFPARDLSKSDRGPRVLFDPVFTQRCSPVQWMGPKRYTPAPIPIEGVENVDAVVISHNHYDHMDTNTLTVLAKRAVPPQVFVPLGNEAYMQCIGFPKDHIHSLDWWESRRLTVNFPTQDEKSFPVSLDVTCTPAQHMTGRSVAMNDRFKTLWASWAVKEVRNESDQEGLKVWFGGDTGYRAVMDGQDEATVPVCPAFKEIGQVFGGFDFAMIPIGAYLPRQFMSPIHCAPQDSVRIFQDIGAKNAIGMHWGTWILTIEEVTAPPIKLKEEAAKLGIEEGKFTVCDIGETTLY